MTDQDPRALLAEIQARADSNQACYRCSLTKREHQTGYAASRCTFTTSPPADPDKAAMAAALTEILNLLDHYPAAVTAYLGDTEVTTVEELDALPWWSLVQGYDGFKHLRHPDGWMLAVFGSTKPHLAREIELPATVLHRPAP